MATDKEIERDVMQLFDDLVTMMQRPGYAEAVMEALFTDTDTLNKHYRLGTTETKSNIPPGRNG